MMGWFYDDGKDIIEICRVAAYLNNYLQPVLVDFFKELCATFLPDGSNNSSHTVTFLIFLEQSPVKKSPYKIEWVKNKETDIALCANISETLSPQ